jgi:hypothetical protein
MTHEKDWRRMKLLIGTKSNYLSQFYRLLLIARSDEKYIETLIMLQSLGIQSVVF